jgi:eukaryotic-like serine/threonine-protein kinase
MEPLPGRARGFTGTARYEVLRELGAGGMGIVYAVYDRERQATVALKLLSKADPEWLSRFKREFRALADVSHPNLITYYELESDGDRWFFTMELVEGLSFLEHVRAKPFEAPSQASLELSMAPTIPNLAALSEVDAARPAAEATDSRPHQPLLATRAHIGRLRSAARQLASGIQALHKSGRLHCDLKPSNVMVANSGRLVILDFGLVADLAKGSAETPASRVAGTPLYMAPEQAAGSELSEGSDWYSFGVMLYEALAGRAPHLGAPAQVIVKKLTQDIRPPSTIVDGVPQDLDELIMQLLERKTEGRPRGQEVLERLGATAEAVSVLAPTEGESTVFVGREQELLGLRGAFGSVVEGRSVSVHVVGSSGVGKSALIRRFLSYAERKDAVVLEGRCYERESVPYKALDSLVDGLTRYLSTLKKEQAHELIPPTAAALARIFPVMGAIESIAAGTGSIAVDPLEVRRIAFSALRSILSRISKQRRLVMYIDDLHWGDEDSAPFLAELLRPPDAPALLLLLAYRREEGESSELVRALKRVGVESGREGMVTIDLDALSMQDARSLALEVLRASTPGPRSERDEADLRRRADRVAHESRGIPFFVGVLARMAAHPESAAKDEEITLDQAILRSLGRLGEAAREIVEIVAVAGRPISIQLLARAAKIEGEILPTLSILRASQFLRTVGVSDQERIVTFHDRIREVVVANLPAQPLRERHRALAEALEGLGQADPEALVMHLRGAGENERAAHYAEIAGDKAGSTLAFDQAARFYRQVLELRPEGSDRFGIELKLAEALSSAGRGRQAAEAFLAAAPHTDERRAIELKRRAGEELLISGHIDRGTEVLAEIVRAVGMKMPSSLFRKLFNVLTLRLRIKLRGELRFTERPESQIDPDVLTKMDVCWTILRGLGMIDILLGEEFASRGWLLALQQGEIFRIARQMPHRLGVTGFALRRNVAKEQRLERALTSIHAKVDRADVIGRGYMGRGLVTFYWGDFRVSLEHFEKAREILHGAAIGAAWEAATADGYYCSNLYYLGRMAEAIRVHHETLANAEARGDWWAQIFLKLGMPSSVWLAEGDVDTARRMAKEALAGWPGEFLNMPQQFELVAKAQLALYEHDGVEASSFMEKLWSQPGHRVRMMMQYLVIELGYLRGRAALGGARRRGQDIRSHLAIAAKAASSMEKTKAVWPMTFVETIRAGIATAKGEQDRAATLLRQAEEHADSRGMILNAMAARRQRGVLIGGDQGQALVSSADEWFARESVRNPERFAQFLVPLPGVDK